VRQDAPIKPIHRAMLLRLSDPQYRSLR
jgi:hypothetical protein